LGRATLFEQLVLLPLARLSDQPPKARLILIDAFDESLCVPQGIVDLLADTLNQWPQWLRIVATSRSYPEVLERLHKALGFKTRTETFEAIVFSWDCFKITKDRETRHDRSRAVSLG
jgi:hypothetical protein